MEYDVLVVGGGIAGMESGLTLGDMGYKVLLVEKEVSIGGKMILLSKVFPTLDCSSCISTPKMAATAHHPNLTVLTYSEVEGIVRKDDGTFTVRLLKKPTFVDPAACTGCGDCELACTVAISDKFNADLVATRAAHIAFPQAVPKKAVIERAGSSPCNFTCPAGVKAHGYVSLVRSGKYEEAFRLHMEDAPLPGALSRACYAPCEGQCTRDEVEGKVPIRGIKRFMVDYYYERHPEPEYGPPEARNGKTVAVVGSGPAGLSAAYFLARRGYGVTVFEGGPEAGGMLRHGIPPFRLPKELVDRDIRNVTALGVEIRTGTPVGSIASLNDQGFDAAFLALGTMEGQGMEVPGRELSGVLESMELLATGNAGGKMDLSGKRVAVIGGGNVAIDSARMALRMGAGKVAIHYRRSRAEMPAHDFEVQVRPRRGGRTPRTPDPEPVPRGEREARRGGVAFHEAGGTRRQRPAAPGPCEGVRRRPPGGHRGAGRRAETEHPPVRDRARIEPGRDDPGRSRDACDLPSERIRRRRRRDRPLHDHRGDRAGEARRLLYRPVPAGAPPVRDLLRRPPLRR